MKSWLVFAFVISSHAFAEANVSWSGDLRYRLAQSQDGEDDQRTYQQLRARFGIKAEVNEWSRIVLRMMSATSPISGNQTLGDAKDPGTPRRNFGLDLAYIDMRILESGQVWLGRAANPFWTPMKSQLVFDSDLAFEGVVLKWEPKWSHSNAFANLGGFTITENYTAPDDYVDQWLVSGQLGYSARKDDWRWTASVANHFFLNIKNKMIFVFDKSAEVDPLIKTYPYTQYFGNTVYVCDPSVPVADYKYCFKSEYIVQEVSAEIAKSIGDLELGGFVHFIRNDTVRSQGRGSELGLFSKYKSWTFNVAQIVKEADATVGAFTDSDTNGGGTDNEGMRYQVGFQAAKNVNFNTTHFVAKKNVQSTRRNFEMTQLDLMVSF